MKQTFKKYICVGLIIVFSVLSNHLVSDMYGRLPEGLPISWLENQNPHYSVFEDDFIDPPQYLVIEESKGHEKGEDPLAYYDRQKIKKKIKVFFDHYQKKQRALKFSNTFSPVELAPADFMQEHAGVAPLLNKISKKQLQGWGDLGKDPLSGKEGLRRWVLESILPSDFKPPVRSEHEVLIAQVFFNIRASQKSNFMATFGNRFNLSTTIPFPQSEGQAFLREMGTIGRRSSLHHFELYRKRSSKFISVARKNFEEIAQRKFKSFRQALKWDKTNKNQTVNVKTKKPLNFSLYLNYIVDRVLSHERYYNYNPDFAWLLREFPRVFSRYLIGKLKSQHSIVRRNAAALIGDFKPHISDELFDKILQTDDPVVKIRLISALTKSNDTRLIGWIDKNFNNVDQPFQARLIHSVASFQDTSQNKRIENLIDKKEFHYSALDVLSRLPQGGDSWFELNVKGEFPSPVISKSQGKDWNRYYSLMALAQRGNQTSLQNLYELWQELMVSFPSDRVMMNEKAQKNPYLAMQHLGAFFQDERAFYGSVRPLDIFLKSKNESIIENIIGRYLIFDDEIIHSKLIVKMIESLSHDYFGLDWVVILSQWIDRDLKKMIINESSRKDSYQGITKKNQEVHGTVINRDLKKNLKKRSKKLKTQLDRLKKSKKEQIKWAQTYGPKYVSSHIRSALLKRLYQQNSDEALKKSVGIIRERLKNKLLFTAHLDDYDTALSLLCFNPGNADICLEVLNHKDAPSSFKMRVLGSLVRKSPQKLFDWIKNNIHDSLNVPLPVQARAIHLLAYLPQADAMYFLLDLICHPHPDLSLVAQLSLMDKTGKDHFFDPTHKKSSRNDIFKKWEKELFDLD